MCIENWWVTMNSFGVLRYLWPVDTCKHDRNNLKLATNGPISDTSNSISSLLRKKLGTPNYGPELHFPSSETNVEPVTTLHAGGPIPTFSVVEFVCFFLYVFSHYLCHPPWICSYPMPLVFFFPSAFPSLSPSLKRSSRKLAHFQYQCCIGQMLVLLR